MRKLKSGVKTRTLVLMITLSCIILNLNAQSDQLKNLPQYLFPDFVKSVIKMKKGEELVLMVNYNIVTEKMIAHQNDKLYEVPNKVMVDSVIAGTRKFVPDGKDFMKYYRRVKCLYSFNTQEK